MERIQVEEAQQEETNDVSPLVGGHKIRTKKAAPREPKVVDKLNISGRRVRAWLV